MAAFAYPLLGHWICDSSEDQIMVEVTQDQIALVGLLEGATVYRRGAPGSDKLVLKSSPPITLAASFHQATLRLVSTPAQTDLSRKQLSESSSVQVDPLPAKNGGSLLDMDVLISKSFLESDQVKKNLKGQYLIDSLKVCIADSFLPLSFLGKKPRRLSILIENNFIFWGALLPPSSHLSTACRSIDDAAKLALNAQQTAIDALLKSNEGIAKLAGAASSNAVEGYKEAAKVAQTTNEKSMDSMSKVATAAAARKPTKEEAEAASTTECKNQECDFVFEGKVKKFCPKCGTNQL